MAEDGHLGARYEVTGPRHMTFTEIAQVLSTTLDREIQHIPISQEEFHANVAASGDRFVADVSTAGTLDGRKPRDFAEFAQTAMTAGTWPNAA